MKEAIKLKQSKTNDDRLVHDMQCVCCFHRPATQRLKSSPHIATCDFEECVNTIFTQNGLELPDLTPEILLHILLNFIDDKRELLRISQTNKYLNALVAGSPELWTGLNPEALSEGDRERFRTEPRTVSRDQFIAIYNQAKIDAAPSSSRSNILIFVVTRALTLGHLGLARYADSIRERPPIADIDISFQAELSFTFLTFVGITPLNDYMREAFVWALDNFSQRMLGGRISVGFVSYLRALVTSLSTGIEDTSRIMLDHLDDPTLQLSSRLSITQLGATPLFINARTLTLSAALHARTNAAAITTLLLRYWRIPIGDPLTLPVIVQSIYDAVREQEGLDHTGVEALLRDPRLRKAHVTRLREFDHIRRDGRLLSLIEEIEARPEIFLF